MFFRTKAPLDLLYRHLRRFIKLPDESEHWAFFRFWDPAVLGGYLEAQTCEGMGDLCRALLTLEDYGLTVVLERSEGFWIQIPGYISGPRLRLLLSARNREQLSRPVRARYADQLAQECSRRIVAVPASIPTNTGALCHKVADFVYLHGGRGSATVRQGVALAMILLMMDRSAGDNVLAGPVMHNPDLPLGERIDMTVNSFITVANQMAGGRN